ncbi:MAG TPA: DUF1003 domain-containing protein [Gemmatimonadaceae bacterium]|nr:DUF1003 domain-containing protein [Gemmatimonadaceae bacterium]
MTTRTELEDSPSERRQRALGTRRAIQSIKAQRAAERTWLEVVADLLIRLASSGPFLAFHTVWFLVWIAWNVGALSPFGLRPFDPFPFGLLTLVVSLEAIFLSIFVLMGQGRESQIAELREEVTLQVLLRAEEEVTKSLQLIAGLYRRLDLRLADDPELREMLRPLDAEEIEEELTRDIASIRGAGVKPPRSRAEGAR